MKTLHFFQFQPPQDSFITQIIVRSFITSSLTSLMLPKSTFEVSLLTHTFTLRLWSKNEPISMMLGHRGKQMKACWSQGCISTKGTFEMLVVTAWLLKAAVINK